MTELKRTPLHEEHVGLNAKLVPFAGYAMPVQYPAGIRREHEAVRTAAGLFDVSHMGEFRVSGPGALAFVSRVTTNDPAALTIGAAQYSVFCYPDGGVVDDLLVYRLGEEVFRLVVNAANIAKDWAHIQAELPAEGVELVDESDDTALIALQGPRAAEIFAPLASVELHPIGFYKFTEGEVAGTPALISRTGYTGEDGFELYVARDRAARVWRDVLEAGRPLGLIPAGLGSRDTLRLEMGYALYGNDIDARTTPLEAGLGWLVKLRKEAFIGREALLHQNEIGVSRRLTGFRLTERGFPRAGYDVSFRGQPAGKVRSGTVSPSLGYGIGMAYLAPDARVGEAVQVHIRGREFAAEVSAMPFYTDGSIRR